MFSLVTSALSLLLTIYVVLEQLLIATQSQRANTGSIIVDIVIGRNYKN